MQLGKIVLIVRRMIEDIIKNERKDCGDTDRVIKNV